LKDITESISNNAACKGKAKEEWKTDIMPIRAVNYFIHKNKRCRDEVCVQETEDWRKLTLFLA
jgi:hypothetical protein